MKQPLKIIICFIMMFTLLSCNSIDVGDIKDDLFYTTQNNSEFEYTHIDDQTLRYNAINSLQSIKYEDGYLYFYPGEPSIGFQNGNTLLRYNCKTNNLTTVCSDPLCSHDTPECKLYGMTPIFCIYNDILYFRKAYTFDIRNDNDLYQGKTEWSGFCGYDMDKSSIDIYTEYSSLDYYEHGLQLYTDNYRFYYDYVYSDKLEQEVFAICRMDLKTNEIKVLGGENNISDDSNPSILAQMFLFSIDNRIYFTDGNSIYSTDYDAENKIIHAEGRFSSDIYTDAEYIYYPISNEDNTQSIYRMDIDGNNPEFLNIITDRWYKWVLTENYIYYSVPESINIGKCNLSGYSGHEVILYNSEIRRCNHDGSNDERVYKFENEFCNYRLNNIIIAGNYIYGLYTYWNDIDDDNVFEDGEYYQSGDYEHYNIMRININTGEVYYIYAE